MSAASSIIVIGGNGALGRALVKRLLLTPSPTLPSISSSVISIDLSPNPDATHSILLPPPSSSTTTSWHNAGAAALLQLKQLPSFSNSPPKKNTPPHTHPLRAIFHVAGGWKGGAVTDAPFLESVEEMWTRNVQSAALAACLAGAFFASPLSSPAARQQQGLVVLTGAAAALDPATCTGMVGYGLSKNATHFLTHTLAQDPHLQETGTTALAILPATIDTPANRAAMPNADFSGWTKPEEIAEKMVDWLQHPLHRPPSGSLVKVLTSHGKTSWTPVPPLS